MVGEQKNTSKEFRGFCKGIPFAEMMQKMMDGHGMGSFCAEMMEKVMGTEGGGLPVRLCGDHAYNDDEVRQSSRQKRRRQQTLR